MNLLTETIEMLENHSLAPNDVVWVGSRDGNYAISWQSFTKIANVKYDSGYGGSEVVDDLVVVGDNWWLERHEYGGSEWWEFKQQPTMLDQKSFDSVIKKNYESTIAEMMEGKHGEED